MHVLVHVRTYIYAPGDVKVSDTVPAPCVRTS
jgi:hypothetical protein